MRPSFSKKEKGLNASGFQSPIPAIQAEDTCWAGATTWRGCAAMRISVSSWATTEADVAQSLEAMIRVGKQNLSSTYYANRS